MSATVSAGSENPQATAPPAQVVTRLLAETGSRPAAEQVMLWADRYMFLKRRWRGVADDGTEFGFDLESRLRDGGVIHRTAGAEYIIRQRPETIYVVRPASAEEAALAGWKIGNLHMPVEITGGEIRVLHDSAVLQLLEREGWAREERTVVFNPLRVAAHAS